MQYHCFVIRVLVKRRTENGMKRENIFVFFFVLGFFVPLENFSLIWRRNRWRAANFDLCSALMAIDQWRLFSMPHLLWHGASVIIVISKDPWQTHIAERLAVELSLPAFYDLGLLRLRFGHQTFRMRIECSNQLCHRRCYTCEKHIYTIFLAINTFSSGNTHIHNKKTGSIVTNNKLLIFCFEPCWLIKQSFKSS